MEDLKQVLRDEAARAAAARLERVSAMARMIDSLRSRGLLKRQEFHAPTSAEFEQLYSTQR